jgi:hypothetical protein
LYSGVKGLFKKRQGVLSPEEMLEHYSNKIDEELISEFDNLMRTVVSVDFFKRSVDDFNKGREKYLSLYKSKAMPGNPISIVIGVGSSFSEKVGHLSLRNSYKDYLAKNFDSMTLEDYKSMLRPFKSYFYDVDLAVIAKNNFEDSRRRMELHRVLGNDMEDVPAAIDLHIDRVLTEEEMIRKYLAYKEVLDKYPNDREYTQNGEIPLPRNMFSNKPKTKLEEDILMAVGPNFDDIFLQSRKRAVILYRNEKTDPELNKALEQLKSDGLLREYQTYLDNTLIQYRDEFRRVYGEKKLTSIFVEISEDWHSLMNKKYSLELPPPLL